MLAAYPPPNFWILHIDGSARPNPGQMSIGAVLTAPCGSRWELARALPGLGCNNEAELHALLAGLDLAMRLGALEVRIYTDSQWLVEQLHHLHQPSQGPRCLRPTHRLRQWLQQAHVQLAAFAHVQWRWIPRHCHLEADSLAREAALSSTNEKSTKCAK